MPVSDTARPPNHASQSGNWIASGRTSGQEHYRSTVSGAGIILGIAVVALILALLSGKLPSGDLPGGLGYAQIVAALALLLCGTISTVLLVRSASRARELVLELVRQGELALAQTQAILTTSGEGVFVVDEQCRVLSANPTTERLFGVPLPSLIGQPAALLLPDRNVLGDRSQLPRRVETTGLRQGTQHFPIEVNLSEMTVHGQRHLVALVRDISDRERNVEILRQIGAGVGASIGTDGNRPMLRELAAALGTTRAFIVELVGEGATAVAMRTFAENGELRGTGPFDLRNTACAETLSKGYRFMASGARAAFPEDTMLAEAASDAYAGMPLVDPRGRVLGVIGVLHAHRLGCESIAENVLRIFATRAAADIERKRADEALAAEKERLAVTLRSIGDACITLDNDGRIVMFNAVAERLTGVVHEDAAGRLVSEVLNLVDSRTRRRAQHLLQRVATTGTTDNSAGLNILIPTLGQERTVEISSAPIRDRLGRKLGAIIVLRDVTERLRAEEERLKAEKLESLGLVAGGIAHDFNNLLTAILGNVTLGLADQELPATVRDYLGHARKASQRAQELAGQLLTFSKGGAPIKQTADLRKLLSDTVHCALAGSRTGCDWQIADDLWPIEADPGQLSQVIANITTNAEQAMPAGGNIVITAENFELPLDSISLGLRAGRWVRFSVEDHGVGIPDEYLKKIFDPYFTTKPTGSGLGLATAYSIIKNHDGVILVESKPGVGSTFTVYLPASEKQLLPTPEPPPEATPRPGGRVLILDDEEVICMLVTCALEPLGYEVVETQDGKDALRIYEESMKDGRKFDVVISDLTMPGRMSGQEAIQKLRELDPDVCAIVSSGYANDPVMSRYQEYGFTGMIAKPYEIDALGRKVNEVLAQRKKPRVIFHDFDNRKTA